MELAFQSEQGIPPSLVTNFYEDLLGGSLSWTSFTDVLEKVFCCVLSVFFPFD
jgi:uncharacterized membrane protein